MITALTLAPVVAAVLILALPERRARAVALAGALVSLTLAVWMLVQFNEQPGDLKFVEKVEWISQLDTDQTTAAEKKNKTMVSYFVGLDGTNALVLLLAAEPQMFFDTRRRGAGYTFPMISKRKYTLKI